MATKKRTIKSSAGVKALLNDTLSHVFGLTPETMTFIRKKVQERGEWPAVQQHVRNLDGSAHSLLNQAIDRIEKSTPNKTDPRKAKDNKLAAKSNTSNTKKEGTANKSTTSTKPQPGKKPVSTKGKKEDIKESFIGYILNEISDADVALAFTPAQDDFNLMKNKSLGQRKMINMKRQQELQRSQDPIDRQIADLKRRLAMLIKKKQDAQGGGL